MSDWPIEHCLKIDLNLGQKLTLDPPLTIIREGHDDELLTGLEFAGFYRTGTMALQIYCKDNELGSWAPFDQLSICIPEMNLSSPNHFFVKDPSIAKAFISGASTSRSEPISPN
jgi:hypothetical protein